ncbi:MAG: nucleotidyltransferase domain-containing protein [Leptospirales bacterium]
MISGETTEGICRLIHRYYSDVQGVYIFGSLGTEFERPESDADIAVLLPHDTAKSVGSLAMSECSLGLSDFLHRPVDLVNIRQMNTVFQLQVMEHGRLIDSSDKNGVDVFEMLTLSFYQKLQQERSAILSQIVETKQVLNL